MGLHSVLAVSSLAITAITLSGCGGQSCHDLLNGDQCTDTLSQCHDQYCSACGDCEGESGTTETQCAGAAVVFIAAGQGSCSSMTAKSDTIATIRTEPIAKTAGSMVGAPQAADAVEVSAKSQWPFGRRRRSGTPTTLAPEPWYPTTPAPSPPAPSPWDPNGTNHTPYPWDPTSYPWGTTTPGPSPWDPNGTNHTPSPWNPHRRRRSQPIVIV